MSTYTPPKVLAYGDLKNLTAQEVDKCSGSMDAMVPSLKPGLVPKGSCPGP